MKKKNGLKFVSATAVVLLVATMLVTVGAIGYKWALDTDNQFLAGLFPDVLGGGIFIFALFLIVIGLGFVGIKIKMKYM